MEHLRNSSPESTRKSAAKGFQPATCRQLVSFSAPSDLRPSLPARPWARESRVAALLYALTCTSTVERGTGRMPRISSAFLAAVCSLSFMELPSPVATSFPSTETLEVKLGLWAGPAWR